MVQNNIKQTLDYVNEAMGDLREGNVRDAFNNLNYARKTYLKHPTLAFEETVKKSLTEVVELLRAQRMREAKERLENTQRDMLVFVTRNT